MRINGRLLSIRIWMWVKSGTTDHFSVFNISRDSIYGAIILLGVGGATMLAIAMAMFSFLIGKHTVRNIQCQSNIVYIVEDFDCIGYSSVFREAVLL